VRGTAHKIYGYALFLGTLPLLFVFAYYLNKFRVGPSAQSTKKVAPTNLQGQSWSQGLASYGNLILPVLLILIPILVHTKLITQSPVPLRKSFSSFPTIIGKWKGNETPDYEWHPKIIGAEDNMRRLYKNNEGDEIRVYVSYLPIQTQGQELVYHANTIIPDRFKYKNRNVRTWTINSGSHKLNLKTYHYLLKNGLYDEIFLYWYQNTSHYLYSDYAAKAYMALDNLIKNRSNGVAYVLIFKVSIRDKKDHEIELQDFLNVFMSEIIKYLPA
jgi:EpsI family protein